MRRAAVRAAVIATITAFWNEAKPVLQGSVDDIRALREPKADTKQVNRILDAVEHVIARVDADPTVLPESDTSNVFAKPDKLARKYGFKVCGSSSD
jgi:hypothetical protein